MVCIWSLISGVGANQIVRVALRSGSHFKEPSESALVGPFGFWVGRKASVAGCAGAGRSFAPVQMIRPRALASPMREGVDRGCATLLRGPLVAAPAR
jgi:hypothetical protein